MLQMVIESTGITHNSKSWVEYERAKKFISKLILTPDAYQKLIKDIAEYIGV